MEPKQGRPPNVEKKHYRINLGVGAPAKEAYERWQSHLASDSNLTLLSRALDLLAASRR